MVCCCSVAICSFLSSIFCFNSSSFACSFCSEKEVCWSSCCLSVLSSSSCVFVFSSSSFVVIF